MKSINSIVGVYDNNLFKTLEEKIGEKELFELWEEKILTNEKFIYAEEYGYLLLKSDDLNCLLGILGIERNEVKLECLSDVAIYHRESYEYGIREYDCFHFRYNEIYNQLIMYFDDSSNADEIWSNIKLNGLYEFLEKKYKDQARVMVKNRLKELQDFAENGEIEIW